MCIKVCRTGTFSRGLELSPSRKAPVPWQSSKLYQICSTHQDDFRLKLHQLLSSHQILSLTFPELLEKPNWTENKCYKSIQGIILPYHWMYSASFKQCSQLWKKTCNYVRSPEYIKHLPYLNSLQDVMNSLCTKNWATYSVCKIHQQVHTLEIHFQPKSSTLGWKKKPAWVGPRN
jgi:hypothetical protein